MPNLRQLISPQIPQLGACGTSLGMTSKKDASLGMSVGTVRLTKNLSRKGGIYPAIAHTDLRKRKRAPYMAPLQINVPTLVGAGFIPARAQSIPCFSTSKRRTLNEMMWSVSRPRSTTPDSGGDKPLPYDEFYAMKRLKRGIRLHRDRHPPPEPRRGERFIAWGVSPRKVARKKKKAAERRQIQNPFTQCRTVVILIRS